MKARNLIVLTIAFVVPWTSAIAREAPGVGRLVLVAGGGTEGGRNGNGNGNGNGVLATRAKLNGPFGVAFDAAGTLYFVEMPGNRVRKIGADGIVTPVAGTGHKGFSGDGGPAVSAELDGPHSLAVMRNGDILIADTWNNRVRKVDAHTGRITTIIGTGHKGFSGDGGPAERADFGAIYCLALDEDAGTLDLADLDNGRIRRVDLKTGTVSTIAGNGRNGVPADGAVAKDSPLVDPRAVAVDGRGNVYILERSGHALRVVDRSGKIRTLAGDGKKGDSGDGGDARSARLNGPKHLCVDPEGNVLIADTENHRIRVYRPADGTIRTIVGMGHKGTGGLDGPADHAELAQPHGVTIGPGGILYVSDSSNNRILKIAP